MKVADREDGLRELSNAERGAHRPLKRAAGASARRSQAARHATDSTQGIAGMQRRASPHAPVPGRVLSAPRLEGLLVTSAITTTPRRASQVQRAPSSAPSATFRTTPPKSS